MPQLGSFEPGKREPEPPRPVAVTFGTPEDKATWGRLLFAKYLYLTHRIGDDDVGVDDG